MTNQSIEPLNLTCPHGGSGYCCDPCRQWYLRSARQIEDVRYLLRVIRAHDIPIVGERFAQIVEEYELA